MKMLIKTVSNKDQLNTIENLAHEIWNAHYTPIIGKEQIRYMLEKYQSVEAMSEQIKNGSIYFLSEHNKLPIGYMSVNIETDTLFLSKLYVLESERCKGYGRQMIIHLELLSKEKNLNKISLTVNKHNTQSIKMYEKVGFVISGKVVKDIGQGFVMDDYQMEKSV